MNNRFLHIIYGLAAAATLLLPACKKEPVSMFGTETPVYIDAEIMESVATKAPFFGTSFPEYDENNHNGSYGIFVCQHGTTDKANAHKSNSWNIQAKYEDSAWTYYYVSKLSTGVSANYGLDHITLTERSGGETADLYAYAPYAQSAYTSAGPTAIPYSIKDWPQTQYDLMYAVENTTSANTELDPADTSPLSAHFTFKHAYALLRFRFKLAYDSSTGAYGSGSSYKLDKITITRNDPDSNGEIKAKLYKSGTFDATTGTFNDDGVEVDSFEIVGYETYPNSAWWEIESASIGGIAYLWMVPTEVDDDELVFTFDIGKTLQPFYLKRSYLTRYTDDTHTTPVAGTEGKFLGGYMYTFTFTLDNYVYFDGFSVSEGWSSEILGSQEI